MKKTELHCNTAGVGRICRPAVEAMRKAIEILDSPGFYEDSYWHLNKMLDDTRRACAGLLRVGTDEIALVTSTTDGLGRILRAMSWQPGDVLAIGDNPYVSTRVLASSLERSGVSVQYIGDNRGHIHPADIVLLPRRTKAVLIDWVHWSSGHRNNVQAIATLCARTGLPLILDAVQGLGAAPLDFNIRNVAALVSGGHKWLRAPEGTGLVYLNQSFQKNLTPVMPGYRAGTVDKHGAIRFETNSKVIETGTLPLVVFVALGAAVTQLLDDGYYARITKIQSLSKAVTELLSGTQVTLLSPTKPESSAGIIAFRLRHESATQTVERLFHEQRIIAKERDGYVRLSPDPDLNSAELCSRLAKSLAVNVPTN